VLTRSYWVIECEGRNWWERKTGKLLTEGMCVVLSCMVSGADWRLLGNLMGSEILVCERNFEKSCF